MKALVAILKRARRWFDADQRAEAKKRAEQRAREVGHLKSEIAERKRRHEPVWHLRMALQELRHEQLKEGQ